MFSESIVNLISLVSSLRAEDAPQIKDWGSCHEVTEGADCVAVGGNPEDRRGSYCS